MSMPTSETLDLAHLDEAGIDRLYTDRIEPLLAEREQERLEAVGRYRLNCFFAVLAALAVAAVVQLIWFDTGVSLIVGLFVLVGGAALAYAPLNALAGQIKTILVGTLAQALGVSFTAKHVEPPALERFKALSLLPSCDRSSFEDFFHGERQGCRFDLYEALLEDERRDKDGDVSYVTVFHGQLIRIAFPKTFLGVTIVQRDAGVFNAFRSKGAGMERVGLVDSRFERAFEVYATDQVEARYLVHPVFMERLLELEATFKGKAIRCAFEQGDLLVAVEGGDRFEVGSMFKPLASQERVRRVIDDIAKVMRLMDAVLTAEQGPLVARRLSGA